LLGSSGGILDFSDYKLKGGISIPTVIVHESGESKDVTKVENLDVSIDGAVSYGMPTPSQKGYTSHLLADTNIEVKRLYGYLFVKPKLDGKDEGWWFLDTGAEIMVIDPVVARAHNMRIVGKELVAGVVASVTTNFSKGVEFNLGPVTIKDSSYMELDMKPFSDALGIKLAGICGYDFLSRVSVDIDPKKQTIGVYPSGNNASPLAPIGQVSSFMATCRPGLSVRGKSRRFVQPGYRFRVHG
jgi:hypothetical protein